MNPWNSPLKWAKWNIWKFISSFLLFSDSSLSVLLYLIIYYTVLNCILPAIQSPKHNASYSIDKFYRITGFSSYFNCNFYECLFFNNTFLKKRDCILIDDNIFRNASPNFLYYILQCTFSEDFLVLSY